MKKILKLIDNTKKITILRVWDFPSGLFPWLQPASLKPPLRGVVGMEVPSWLANVPLLFKENRIDRFYIGGSGLAAWRHAAPEPDGHHCEELLVSSIGAIVTGKPAGYAVSVTIDEQGALPLDKIIQAYPDEVLGTSFQEYNPGQLSVLARAGDTTVRLPMQCHPTKADARRYFDMPMGKTEAWYIARTREDCDDPCVYVGFRPHVTRELFERLFMEQDIEGMLGCLHRISVRQGDVVLVPAGMPHCVGPGCLFVEFHECNDMTIRVEREVNGLVLADEELFGGLDVEHGLGLFDYTTYTEDEVRRRCVMDPKQLDSSEGGERFSCIGPEQGEGFELEVVNVHGLYGLPRFDGHRVLVALEGDVELEAASGTYRLGQGYGACVPAACKELVLKGGSARIGIGVPRIVS